MADEIEIEMLNRLLDCNPDTGFLTWKKRTVDLFDGGKYSAERDCARWNGQFAGKSALATDNGQGYKRGRIFSTTCLSHRVVWAMVHGEWPAGEIDHINGMRDDNRLVNLRAVTRAENMRNAAMPITNTSGVMGVSWYKPSQKWCAFINVKGKRKHLGYFTDKADAIAARAAAEAKYGFHENHGR